MNCDYFGLCGSCKIYEGGYEGQLQKKLAGVKEGFDAPYEVFTSPDSHYRARAEFKIYKDDNDISYAMHKEGGGFVQIEQCPIVLKPVYSLMPKLLEQIKRSPMLKKRLFRVDFLSGLWGEVLVSLIYHKKIDEKWQKEAQRLAEDMGINIVGRSRGVKIVVGRDFIYERLPVFDKEYTYIHKEGSFTQPNPYVNIKMIEWAKQNSKGFGGDLLELYCGAGNFTLPLAQNFDRVLATEISKSSIKAAKEAQNINGIENIDFVRISSEEFSQALNKERSFNRLKDLELEDYHFKTLFVDPPRCGLDGATINLAKRFENIIYISCNPDTLKRDLEVLKESFDIKKLAFFDQFPYTPHLECGVILIRR